MQKSASTSAICEPSTTGRPQDSMLVRMLSKRREAELAKIHGEEDPLSRPRPLVKPIEPKPSPPTADDSEAWGRLSKKLDRPTLARIYLALEDRLGREEAYRQREEAKLVARSGKPTKVAAQSLMEIPARDRARAIVKARERGVYPDGAAGQRPTASDIYMQLSSHTGYGESFPKPRRGDGRPASVAGGPVAHFY
mmetsp:Transcript_42873/g.100588  ORF Transcript_42873/g.100588 Transcript_42873/m.100588 type:complete len:195 (-) Transcript_42873:69-653(-)